MDNRKRARPYDADYIVAHGSPNKYQIRKHPLYGDVEAFFTRNSDGVGDSETPLGECT